MKGRGGRQREEFHAHPGHVQDVKASGSSGVEKGGELYVEEKMHLLQE